MMTQRSLAASAGTLLLALALACPQTCGAALSRAHLMLIERGLQIEGLVTKDDVFHLSTYTNAGYTGIHWLWESNPSLMGPAPGFLWSRWVSTETNMPPQGDEAPHRSQLFSLQLADEWHINNDALRTRLVNWFLAARPQFPDVILYANSYGGQVSDDALTDFAARARPDMLCFDTYPFKSDYTTRQPLGGTPLNWYGELRRYRQHALANQIPFACYRQTFHAVQDYDQTVYRDPSPSELRLNTFAALAFDCKVLKDFTYNTGASSLFTTPGGDTYTNALYGEMMEVNRRARNLGKALVRLQPILDLHTPFTNDPNPSMASSDPNWPGNNIITTSILFLKGKHLEGTATNANSLPIGFLSDPQALAGYSWWEVDKNDPYLRGWTVTNKAGVKNNGLPGDVILAWFTPLDESFDGPAFTNEIYLMVVNGLSDPTGSAADCAQEITLNFLNSFTSIEMLDPLTGLVQTNTLPVVNTRRRLVLTLNGGDAALFKFSDGAPFVGAHPVQDRFQMNMRLQAGSPALSVNGTAAARCQVEAADSLTATNWQPWTNFMLPAVSSEVPGPAGGNGPRKFFRARATP